MGDRLPASLEDGLVRRVGWEPPGPRRGCAVGPVRGLALVVGGRQGDHSLLAVPWDPLPITRISTPWVACFSMFLRSSARQPATGGPQSTGPRESVVSQGLTAQAEQGQGEAAPQRGWQMGLPSLALLTGQPKLSAGQADTLRSPGPME